jgi:hypothetical protein
VAHLQRAFLSDAHLEGADFFGADRPADASSERKSKDVTEDGNLAV